MIKTIKKKISAGMIFVMVLSIFCCVNPQEVSAKWTNRVNEEKQGIEYTKKIHIQPYQGGSISINAETNYKIRNIKTDSKYLKTEAYWGGIDVNACKKGTYHVTYEVKEKKKTVKLKTTVYVSDDILPFKSITIGGKTLKHVEGGYRYSTYTYLDDGYYDNFSEFYYSPKYKGKMKFNLKPGYKIESILISDTSYDSLKWKVERYSRGGISG